MTFTSEKEPLSIVLMGEEEFYKRFPGCSYYKYLKMAQHMESAKIAREEYNKLLVIK